jgi:hypothetical protein
MTRTFDSTSLGWQLVHLGCGSTVVLRTPLSLLDDTASSTGWRRNQASFGSGFDRRVDATRRKPNKHGSNLVSHARAACQLAGRLLPTGLSVSRPA